MIDKGSAVPLYIQIQNDITDAISSGELLPKSQIPSEFELAGFYNVSRMTVRKALDHLVSKGALFRKQGKGTFVTDRTVNYGLSTIMSFSSTLRSAGFTVTTRILNQEVVPAPSKIISKLTLQPKSQVVFIKRLRFVEGEPSAIHISYLSYPQFAPILDVDLSKYSLLKTVETIGGLTLSYSRDTVQANASNLDESELLGVPLKSPVLVVEGVAYTTSGTSVRYTKAIYRGDIFKLNSFNTLESGNSLITTLPKPEIMRHQ
jgi:GntR family transcriptional regulator